ncbi:LacI family DNA-binding transcriptional regulator [Angustibacter sp. McL0619]|uniref:LacI family DNA-binding transcriptional regulator n=1 Tax=Angustibacter sp. McL0619 TaxID=3415676 RepID=UPI003CEC0393
MGRVTLQTIAEHVGVSRMTVSNAFSRPDQLSAKLRDRILAVAEELGYGGPDPTARALASGTAGTVGVLLSETLTYSLTDEVAMAFLAGISDELAATGLSLTLLSAAPEGDIVPARDVAIDGAIVYSCNPDSSAVSWLMRRRLPLVFVDQAPAPGITSINVDDRLGARAAAEHVIDLGHRQVAIVTTGFAGDFGLLTDPLAADTAHTERQRLLGWLDALDVAGITPTVVRLPHENPDAIGYGAAETLLANDERPTAILCFSDAIARGVIRAIQDAGLQVPDDVSVVGFDDNPISRRISPALTTVRQDVDAKGRAAATALMLAITRAKTRPAGRARHLVLPTELVTRNSTTAVRSSAAAARRPAR